MKTYSVISGRKVVSFVVFSKSSASVDTRRRAVSLQRTNFFWLLFFFVQDFYNNATGRIELFDNQQSDITFHATVPLAIRGCADLTFRYAGNDDLFSNDCLLFIKDTQRSRRFSLRVSPTPGCREYTAVIRFLPFGKTLLEKDSMWKNHELDDIKVRFDFVHAQLV